MTYDSDETYETTAADYDDAIAYTAAVRDLIDSTTERLVERMEHHRNTLYAKPQDVATLKAVLEEQIRDMFWSELGRYEEAIREYDSGMEASYEQDARAVYNASRV